MAFTSGNDVNILQASDASIVGAGAGNDKYILAANQMGAGQTITLSDAQGSNTLQLIGGLTITSSIVANNVAQLTLSNGAVVNINGANNFSYEIGGDPLTGVAGTIQNYNTFATTTLGAPSVPATGTVAGTPNTVIPSTPPSAYTLAASTTFVAEGSTATFTLTAATAPTTDQVFHLTLAGDTNGGTVGAASAADFATVPTTVTLAAGATTATFAVTPIINDGIEGIEGFKFNVLDPAGKAVGTGTPVVLISPDTTTDTTPPVVTAPTAAFTYAENQAAGYLVGTVVATDAVGVTGYSLDAATTTAGLYAIDAKGNITLTAAGAALTAASNDFETSPNTFTLGVTASDAAGNVSSAVNFTANVTNVDDTAPKLATVNPAVLSGTTLFLNFDEALAPKIPASTDFTVIAGGATSVTVNTVNVSGSTVTLLLAATPVGAVTVSYTPNADANKQLQDLAGNKVVAVPSQPVTTDTTAPTLSSSSPVDNATNVGLTDNVVLNFSETVKAGTGNIVITNTKDATDARTISVTDTSQITFSGSTVTVNPTADLKSGGNYVVTITSGVVKDIAGNAFAGVSGTDLDFSTTGGTVTGQTFLLTNGVDAIPGLKGSLGTTDTSGDDIVIGNIVGDTTDTVQVADQVNTGLGSDTFKEYVAKGKAVTIPQLTSVENLFISGNDTSDVNASVLAGVTSLEINQPLAAKNYTLAGTTQSFILSADGSAAPGATVYAANLVYAGTDTAAKITVSSVGNLDNTAVNCAGLDAGGLALATVNLVSTGSVSAGSNQTTSGTLVGLGAANAVQLNNSKSTTATTTLNLSGDTKVFVDLLTNKANFTKLAAVNAGTDTGGVWVDTDIQTGTFVFTGGSGNDFLRLSASDMTTIASGTQLDAGGGSFDTLVISDTAPSSADYAALNAVKSFEVLGVKTDATTIDISKLTSFNKFYDGLTAAGTVTFNNSKSTSVFQIDNSPGQTAVTITNATGETATTINVDNQSGAVQTLATLTPTGAQTINLSSTGNVASSNKITTLANGDNSVINITGDKNLTITNALAGAALGSKVDASAFTGALTVTGSGFADVLIGGSKGDTIKSGAGADTLTGNGGTDKFDYTTVTDSNPTTSVDRITDLQLGNTGTFDTLDITPTGTTVVRNSGTAYTGSVNAASLAADLVGGVGLPAGAANSQAYLFTANSGDQSGRTFLVVDVNDSGTLTAADIVINVTGVSGVLTTVNFV